MHKKVTQQHAAQKEKQKEMQREQTPCRRRGAGHGSLPTSCTGFENKQFVLEANQVVFRNGMSAFVTSNTNFVLMNGNRATVQTAFNTPYPGPNGIGGVTVDGNSSDMKMNIDKKEM